MANSIAFAKNFTGIIDEVRKRASVSGHLNPPELFRRPGLKRQAPSLFIDEMKSGLTAALPAPSVRFCKSQ